MSSFNRFALFCFVVGACGTDSVPPPSPEEIEARRTFIQKVHRTLHPSALPLAADQIDELFELDDEEIVDKLYREPETIESVFKVSLSFLGAPADLVHERGTWAAPPFAFFPATDAARAFRDGEDPLPALFTTQPKKSIGVATLVDEEILEFFYVLDEPLRGTAAERRAAVVALIHQDFAAARANVVALPNPVQRQTVCNDLGNRPIAFMASNIPQILGVPETLSTSARPPEVDEPAIFVTNELCFVSGTVPKAEALARIDAAKAAYDRLFARLDTLFQRWDASPDSAFDALDIEALGWIPTDGGPFPEGDGTQPGGFGIAAHFYPRFWQLALNSSTNYDRRRGAYVLDRFFCDDLKPVGAALPIDHTEGKHGTDPACAACHFKLDPMSGYFRRQGVAGTDFTDELLEQTGGSIIFDDGATLPFTEYEAAWRAPEGSGRVLDVGYIRSTRDPALNSYGDTLYDLDALLRSAPEVERCFVQRAFEFVHGKDQAVDPGFLDDITTQMRAVGGDRMRVAFTRILVGETFKTPKRNSNTCYDLAPGADPKNRPPCEVASILHTHCNSCHSGQAAQGGLDLTKWELGSANDGRGFRHVVDGRPLAHGETFQRMLDRVVTSDTTRQMPLSKDMPLRAREELALWLQGMVSAEP